MTAYPTVPLLQSVWVHPEHSDMVSDRVMSGAESCPQADAQSEGRWGAGPRRGPRRGGERSLEDAAVFQLGGNSERGGEGHVARGRSNGRQHAGEHLESEVLFVA